MNRREKSSLLTDKTSFFKFLKDGNFLVCLLNESISGYVHNNAGRMVIDGLDSSKYYMKVEIKIQCFSGKTGARKIFE